MGFKEVLSSKFSDEKKILLIRYRAIRIIFVFAVLLFFLNFYFLGANFHFELLINFLPFTYIFLLFSLFFFFFFLIKIYLADSKVFRIITVFLLFIFIVLLLLPFTFEGGFLYFVELYNEFFVK